ncbi:response regulator [Lachnospiraceae bacterium WCA-9-b2]|jgi:Response regulators consisting of a CheY-like receiver domain and a winged-helix DNA-binding domain|uniref:Stage 0 sporulation protein A homolog n=1 Tax=Sporofaciens musculi TaxID=2681861 RepID=A0A7X3SK28_9FIRM|nr:response regulator transcription factor [Sporofaciens musculi]MXP76961.1 response regulator [Sporofaciens musculi]
METSRILIVDDNPEIREIIHILLEGEGFCIKEASDGQQALDLTKKLDFDLIILDIMMPGLNGYQTCIEIRKNSNAPILFLSARTKDSDKTLGFSSGGDDYLAKPFSYNELISRAKALIRRYQVYRGKDASSPQTSLYPQTSKLSKEPLIFHHLMINEEKEEVTSDGIPLVLTDTEYAMLLLLVKHRRQIFSAQHLYESVWNEPYYYGANNTVMVHIRNLRLKIEKDPKNPTLLRTVWGKGYRCD